MSISFTGYYQAQLKGKINFPSKPHYICPMGDKTILRAMPKILDKSMKDEVAISYKKDKDDEKLVFKLSPKAYGKLIQAVFNGQEFPVSDGRLQYFTQYLKFLKPNSKITSVTYELPKNQFAELKDPSDGIAVMLGHKNVKRVLTKFEKAVKGFDKNTSEYFDNVKSDHEKFYQSMQNAADDALIAGNNATRLTSGNSDAKAENSYDEMQRVISNFNKEHPCVSKMLYKLISI